MRRLPLVVCSLCATPRATAIACALAIGACYGARETPAPTAPACASDCHGGAGGPAPPTGLWLSGSKSATSERGVGAHQAHLAGGKLCAAVACSACHRMPAAVEAEGHLDGKVEVVFGGVAVTGGGAATWDGTSCDVYCHRGTRPGAGVPRPRWTQVDGTQAACGACHGLPPGGDHPPSAPTACSRCHGQTVDDKGAIRDRALHANGKLEVSVASACSSCHGGAENAAPPLDTGGGSASSLRGVGAHQAHVRGSERHAALDCGECHLKPATVAAPGHLDSALPAEVVFGALARTGGRQPGWDASALACASVYCHALDGAGAPAPSWNTEQKLVCGSCHGLPPAKGRSGVAHPPAALGECRNCHPAVVDAAGKIVSPARHVNGSVDFN